MRSYRAWFYFVLCFSLTIDIPNDLLRMLRKMECIVQLLCLVWNDWITKNELQHFLENIIISMILQFDTKKYELKLWATRISNDTRIQMHTMLYTTYYMSKAWTYSYVSIFAVKAYYWRQWSNMRIAHKRALSFSPNGAHLSKILCVLNEKETVSVFPPHPHALNNANARVQFKCNCNWSACPILCVLTAKTQSAPWNLSVMPMEKKSGRYISKLIFWENQNDFEFSTNLHHNNNCMRCKQVYLWTRATHAIAHSLNCSVTEEPCHTTRALTICS